VSHAIVAASAVHRQPPRPPNPIVLRSMSDEVVHLLARSIHVARWIAANGEDAPLEHYSALSVPQQFALEQEAVEVIRGGDPLACAAALHRAAAAIGIDEARLAEALVVYGQHLQGR
jgi:hypothetical protein